MSLKFKFHTLILYNRSKIPIAKQTKKSIPIYILVVISNNIIIYCTYYVICIYNLVICDFWYCKYEKSIQIKLLKKIIFTAFFSRPKIIVKYNYIYLYINQSYFIWKITFIIVYFNNFSICCYVIVMFTDFLLKFHYIFRYIYFSFTVKSKVIIKTL